MKDYKIMTLEEFVNTPVPLGNTFSAYITHKGGYISALKTGHNQPVTEYNFWNLTGIIALCKAINYPRETMFSQDILDFLYQRFDNAVKDLVCCTKCGKPLFYDLPFRKLNTYHQVWAGFYCEDCWDGEVMDTSGD